MAELAPIKSLNAVFVDDTSVVIDQKALKRDKPSQLVDVTALLLSLLEAKRVFDLVEKECSK